MAAYAPLDLPASGKLPFTDYSRWRLRISDDGDHTWHYLHNEDEAADWAQTDCDKYWLGIPLDLPALPKPTNALEAARNGYRFFKHLQTEDGHWPAEDGGPMFLIPGLVIGSYVTGMPFQLEERLEIIRYLFNHTNEDGGWGIHLEGQSTVFGTALNYCAMRVLGVKADHPVSVKARGCLHKLGGATGVPSWGKFWLSILNVYDWDGNHPIPSELWLLPDWVPFHPHKWWIHTRNVYIPMGYLYGIRYKMEENDLVLALREELYTQNYYSIDWPAQRSYVAAVDLYTPHSSILELLYGVLGTYEQCAFPPLRRAAIQRCYELVVMEDDNTDYQTLGPVSKMMNLIVRAHVDGRESVAYKRHFERRQDFMWLAREGMMMCGTNGSQLWDIAFVAQAIVEGGIACDEEFKDSVHGIVRWLDNCQIKENPKHYETAYRHATKGAWPFSTRTQGYTVSDCTGEGLKAVIYIQDHVPGAPQLVSERRLCDAVDILLSMQNPNGGFASYELVRAPQWLEYLNPAEVFGNIMTEYNYPECTTSVITALSIFRKHNAEYRARDIQRVITKAVDYVHKAQRPDGAWFGSWGVCFTYATQFALESLSLVGETYANSAAVRRACDFIVSKQRADGGWGESYKSCEIAQWVEHEKTQAVQTSWAVMALMYGKYPRAEPIERGVQLVMSRQQPDGSWPQEAVEGVFNKNVAISYPNFKFDFTIWMLGRAHHYLAELRGEKA
ncbi:lanosterol synthase [Trametes versicolor FP-101664 SS1]|uniref:lanosterol synthase n=1 Tax=Trametes versicolor (strain FP-101664) TaxID=717944 RepID=UPI000462206D|nr:lanosterol synthase [Trametes versicolor FP-101664 SS1]EIW59845.1 lanosterol synthase [Trametes versicolor FP-101664 SS1]